MCKCETHISYVQNLRFDRSMPLWEFSSDFYLHNFHFREGFGRQYGMKDHEKHFGISHEGTLKKSGKGTKTADLSTAEAVRAKCDSHNAGLNVWWRLALHTNLRERMLLSLGNEPEESLLAPKYERIHQPEKISQWDKVFARNWAVPARRPHGLADDKGLHDLLRIFSTKNLYDDSAQPSRGDVSLGGFLERIRSEPREIYLTTLSNQFNAAPLSSKDFVGKIKLSEKQATEEYVNYSTHSMELFDSPWTSEPRKVEEFSHYLHDYAIPSDDVASIYGLSVSAHLGRTLKSGPYKGLDKDDSAVEVSTAVHEQLSGMNRFTLAGRQRVQSELKRRGMDAPGVLESVSQSFSTFMNAHDQYSEICSNVGPTMSRSDLTTDQSLDLYSTFFDASTKLSYAEAILFNGKGWKVPEESTSRERSSHWKVPGPKSNLVKKAGRLGINITPRETLEQRRQAPLFHTSLEDHVPDGFEQIHDDLFARKDNKFMVFNGPGARSWKDTNPNTRIASIEDILAGSV